jgi:hypothetical protein
VAEQTRPDAYEPPQLFTHIDDHGKQMWGWRCWGDLNCEGWVGRDLHSQEAANREMDRHIADEHKEATP